MKYPTQMWLSPKDCYRCGQNKCTACGHAHVTQVFTSSFSGETFPIKSYININSKFVIYLVTSISCTVQYVGSTTSTLKTRIRRHLSDANLPLAEGVSMVSRQCQLVHGGATNTIVFSGIEKVTRLLRGGDIRNR